MDFFMIPTNRMIRESHFTLMWKTQLWLAQCLMEDDVTLEHAEKLITTGTKVILDNGAYEGALCDSDAYLSLIACLHPWCIVLPDLINTPPKISRVASLDFMARLKSIKFKGRMMYVPQGRTKEEVLGEFRWAIDSGVKWVYGLGKCYLHWGPDEEAREEFLKDVLAISRAKECEFHILGARQTPTRVFSERGCVIGIDTLKPVRKAYTRMGYKGRLNHATAESISDAYIGEEVLNFIRAYGAKGL